MMSFDDPDDPASSRPRWLNPPRPGEEPIDVYFAPGAPWRVHRHWNERTRSPHFCPLDVPDLRIECPWCAGRAERRASTVWLIAVAGSHSVHWLRVDFPAASGLVALARDGELATTWWSLQPGWSWSPTVPPANLYRPPAPSPWPPETWPAPWSEPPRPPDRQRSSGRPR